MCNSFVVFIIMFAVVRVTVLGEGLQSSSAHTKYLSVESKLFTTPKILCKTQNWVPNSITWQCNIQYIHRHVDTVF